MSDLAQLFKTLSEPVRLRLMVCLLHQKELCVCDFVSGLNLPQSVISRHLAYLRKHDLVVARRDGVWMHYRVNPEQTDSLKLLYKFLREKVAENPELSQDIDNVQASLGC